MSAPGTKTRLWTLEAIFTPAFLDAVKEGDTIPVRIAHGALQEWVDEMEQQAAEQQR